MLGDDLMQQEKDDYVSMSEKFPKLFALQDIQICRVQKKWSIT